MSAWFVLLVLVGLSTATLAASDQLAMPRCTPNETIVIQPAGQGPIVRRYMTNNGCYLIEHFLTGSVVEALSNGFGGAANASVAIRISPDMRSLSARADVHFNRDTEGALLLHMEEGAAPKYEIGISPLVGPDTLQVEVGSSFIRASNVTHLIITNPSRSSIRFGNLSGVETLTLVLGPHTPFPTFDQVLDAHLTVSGGKHASIPLKSVFAAPGEVFLALIGHSTHTVGVPARTKRITFAGTCGSWGGATPNTTPPPYLITAISTYGGEGEDIAHCTHPLLASQAAQIGLTGASEVLWTNLTSTAARVVDTSASICTINNLAIPTSNDSLQLTPTTATNSQFKVIVDEGAKGTLLLANTLSIQANCAPGSVALWKVLLGHGASYAKSPYAMRWKDTSACVGEVYGAGQMLPNLSLTGKGSPTNTLTSTLESPTVTIAASKVCIGNASLCMETSRLKGRPHFHVRDFYAGNGSLQDYHLILSPARLSAYRYHFETRNALTRRVDVLPLGSIHDYVVRLRGAPLRITGQGRIQPQNSQHTATTTRVSRRSVCSDAILAALQASLVCVASTSDLVSGHNDHPIITISMPELADVGCHNNVLFMNGGGMKVHADSSAHYIGVAIFIIVHVVSLLYLVVGLPVFPSLLAYAVLSVVNKRMDEVSTSVLAAFYVFGSLTDIPSYLCASEGTLFTISIFGLVALVAILACCCFGVFVVCSEIPLLVRAFRKKDPNDKWGNVHHYEPVEVDPMLEEAPREVQPIALREDGGLLGERSVVAVEKIIREHNNNPQQEDVSGEEVVSGEEDALPLLIDHMEEDIVEEEDGRSCDRRFSYLSRLGARIMVYAAGVLVSVHPLFLIPFSFIWFASMALMGQSFHELSTKRSERIIISILKGIFLPTSPTYAMLVWGYVSVATLILTRLEYFALSSSLLGIYCIFLLLWLGNIVLQTLKEGRSADTLCSPKMAVYLIRLLVVIFTVVSSLFLCALWPLIIFYPQWPYIAIFLGGSIIVPVLIWLFHLCIIVVGGEKAPKQMTLAAKAMVWVLRKGRRASTHSEGESSL